MKFTLRCFSLAMLLVGLALPAAAVVKVYNATPPNGTPGDRFQYALTLCPTIAVTPGTITGDYTLSDSGGGLVTLTDMSMVELTLADAGPAQLESIFGPGSFVFVSASPTWSVVAPPSGTGSTAPGGTVAWGVIGGWVSTGVGFCIASPQTICTSGSMLPHGVTSPLAPITSPTFDLGTWSFDAADGDLLALNNFINQTNNGGVANRQRLIRGAYVGASVPALPLVGAGAIAIALITAGTRTMLRKK